MDRGSEGIPHLGTTYNDRFTRYHYERSRKSGLEEPLPTTFSMAPFPSPRDCLDPVTHGKYPLDAKTHRV